MRRAEHWVDTGTAGTGKLLVVIPAFNEEAAIADVIASVRLAVPHADVLVVDDGSRDRTSEVARRAGARVATLPFNLGVGGAMRTGFRHAAREGYSAVVQVDGDGQHDPAQILSLLDGLATSDVVIGARFAGSGDYVVRGPRHWAMQVLARVMSWILGVRLNDSTSGFRHAAREGYSAVVQVDGDGQHDARFIPRLVQALDHVDIAVGTRFGDECAYAVRGPRRWAMVGVAEGISALMGTRIDDATSGFRAAGPRAIRVYAEHYPAEYLGDTLETLVIAHKAGLRVSQVPVAMRPRLGGHPSRGIIGSTFDLGRACVVVALGLVRDWSLAPDGAA